MSRAVGMRTRVLRSLVAMAMTTIAVGAIGMPSARANSFTDPDDTSGVLDIKDASVTFDASNATFTMHTYEQFTASSGLFLLVVDINGDSISDRLIFFGAGSGSGAAIITNNWPRGHTLNFTRSGTTLSIVVPRAYLDGASNAAFEVLTTSNSGTDFAPNTAVVFLDPTPRVAGGDRIATAVESCFQIDGSADSIVLARMDGFADALAGGPLAAAKNGCLLLTPSDSLDSRVQAEIQRVLPAGRTVYLLGGELALGPGVASAVSNAGYNVVRLSGDNRYQTALKVATDGLGTPGTVFLATGNNFPDALGAGPAAAARGAAILLSDGSSLPPEVAQFFQDHPNESVFAIGGPAAAAKPSATAIVGSDRYDTAVKLAQQFFNSPTDVGVASGLNFPDALAGGAAMASIGEPMLLTDPSNLPGVVSSYLQNVLPIDAYVFGGPTAVSTNVSNQIAQILAGG